MADNEKNIRSEEEKELIINARKPVEKTCWRIR